MRVCDSRSELAGNDILTRTPIVNFQKPLSNFRADPGNLTIHLTNVVFHNFT